MSVTGDLGRRPDRSVVEKYRQALSGIDSNLTLKLNTIFGLSAAEGMDDIKWRASKTAVEAQARKDAEKEKLRYQSVVQLSELHQIYQNLAKDQKSLPETPNKKQFPSQESDSPAEDAEKKIDVALHGVSLTKPSAVLALNGLFIDDVPESIQKLSSILVKLDLSNNNLRTFPEAVTSLVNLISLDIRSNQITSLPDSIGHLTKLKAVNVSGNLLTTLPRGIESCSVLEELNADFNQLTWLPEGLGFELENLQKLSVHSNRLTRLPYSVSHMMRLRVLDVHLNRLGGLPADLENLMNLEILNLSKNFNYLVALPESIGGLTSLVELDISYNHITALPNSVARLEKLQRVNVEGNPLVVPPNHVVEEGLTAIKEYMSEWSKSQSGKKSRLRNTTSWLGRAMSAKWVRRGKSKGYEYNMLRGEHGFDSSRGNVLSSLCLFSPRHSSLSFRALATPRRTR